MKFLSKAGDWIKAALTAVLTILGIIYLIERIRGNSDVDEVLRKDDELKLTEDKIDDRIEEVKEDLKKVEVEDLTTEEVEDYWKDL